MLAQKLAPAQPLLTAAAQPLAHCLTPPSPPCRPQTRPNKPGEPVTNLLLTHRTGQVDFKLAVVRCVDGAWE